MEGLPDELLLKIFSHLNHRSVLNVRKVCQKFMRIGDDPSLWKRISHDVIDVVKSTDDLILEGYVRRNTGCLYIVDIRNMLNLTEYSCRLLNSIPEIKMIMTMGSAEFKSLNNFKEWFYFDKGGTSLTIVDDDRNIIWGIKLTKKNTRIFRNLKVDNLENRDIVRYFGIPKEGEIWYDNGIRHSPEPIELYGAENVRVMDIVINRPKTYYEKEIFAKIQYWNEGYVNFIFQDEFYDWFWNQKMK